MQFSNRLLVEIKTCCFSFYVIYTDKSRIQKSDYFKTLLNFNKLRNNKDVNIHYNSKKMKNCIFFCVFMVIKKYTGLGQ